LRFAGRVLREGGLDILANPAQAQVNNEVSNAAQPTSFADIVQSVKPSVISVKVTMKDKVADPNDRNGDDRISRTRRWSVFFVNMAAPRVNRCERVATIEAVGP
jgi:hypothetical protein